MKIWSPLLATLVLLNSFSAQIFQDDEINIEVIDDDVDLDVVADSDNYPCNGYPQYRKLPINQGFYLGAQNAGSQVFKGECQASQDASIIKMLEDGIRFLDVNLCTNEKNVVVVCSSRDSTVSSTPFTDVLNEAFIFARENPEQFFIINLRSENVGHQANIKDLEQQMDTICKTHTELTPGTDEYVKYKCPFIYRHEKGPWPSIGELVNYNPEMAQWEGDGELVGVRTKMLFTASESISTVPEYQSSYFTEPFWRESRASEPNKLKDDLKKVCRVPAGGIKLNAYVDDACSKDDYSPEQIEDLLLDKLGCNLNDSPLNTFISILSVNHYGKHLRYLQELKDRMMEINYAKWNGNYQLVRPSVIATKQHKVQRDEL
ncbi:hypothetical protein G6F57_005311 [Rhizopus arrhizus]|uniref:Phosphatidylinositol-specific phospholipase C X domain-containing protein n=1 Tax=Rhizopus oryzae TaxID=64495 RepID=A0A9P6XC62_RHIOR|nr:hypothetical protein G6F23_003402 [Rhizopus arrhizus]KAG1418039.1 hypothetical protein G6F58_005235 [Rhizopus delemar]KAG0949763.1 hypothetical protein G6F30_002066 [Rhizopus arrhizus]KAG0981672.1 hypothetical protein G6F29_006883 [Rhizopus arrhizus]KAG0993221.1 hypothetical protein G6F28_006901 [Rhizopus arrhizus]